MGKLEELSNVDSGWLALAEEIERLGSLGHGAFGHLRQRRLGLRLRTSCWVLLSQGASSTYARATELSSTGVVLEFVGRKSPLLFQASQRFRLDLFVPGASTPVRAVVRPVRSLVDRQAFELVEMTANDRLTLAEHLDRLMAQPKRRAARREATRRPS